MSLYLGESLIGKVSVIVGSSDAGDISTQSKTVTPTESQQTITPDTGYDALSSVVVNRIPSEYIIPTGELSISENGTADVAAYASVDVDVQPVLQSKSATPSESVQTITPDSDYDGLSSVSVGAVSSTYVGSGITRMSSANMTVSGATVTAPAGYYSENASRTIGGGTAATPATTITVTPTISVSSTGLITASASGSQSVTPTVSAGYVSAGTSGRITVSGSSEQQLTAKAAQIYNTSASDQTIASGQYLTGTQTIKAVTTSNLTEANIAAGTTVKVGDANDDDRIASVTGTFTADATATAATINSGETAYVNGVKVTGAQEIVHYYTGSSVPSSSLGSDGDIYLQTA